jgi:hypothetical protein
MPAKKTTPKSSQQELPSVIETTAVPLTFADPTIVAEPAAVTGEIEEVSEAELQQLDESLKQEAPVNIHASKNSSASAFRTIQEIETDLKKPVPSKFVKKLQAGPASGKSYIPWMVVQRILSFYAPGWSTTSSAVDTPVGVGVITHLTIPTATGPVTRAGHGFEPHLTNNGKPTGYGGAIVVASAQAFKRSAVTYGLGRDLYPA